MLLRTSASFSFTFDASVQETVEAGISSEVVDFEGYLWHCQCKQNTDGNKKRFSFLVFVENGKYSNDQAGLDVELKFDIPEWNSISSVTRYMMTTPGRNSLGVEDIIISEEFLQARSNKFHLKALIIIKNIDYENQSKRPRYDSIYEPMNKLLLSSDFSDCIIEICKYSEEQIPEVTKSYPVHKAILASRSEVFKAMLTNNSMKESQTGKIYINDSSAEAIEAMLKYIYTDECNYKKQSLTIETVYEIYRLAHKYQLNGLIKHTEDYFLSNKSLEHIIDVLDILKTYQAIDPYRSCLEYANTHINDILDKLGDTDTTNINEQDESILHYFTAPNEKQQQFLMNHGIGALRVEYL